MKNLLKYAGVAAIGFSVLLSPVNSFSDSRKCEDCPPNDPCGYQYEAGDGCNTCYGTTYCIDDKWYTRGTGMCTTASCWQSYEIKNPFEKEKSD